MRARISTVITVIFLVSLPLFASPAHAAISPGVGISTNGLQMYWDAANYNSYSGSGSAWNDLTGNGFHATIYNSPIYSHVSNGSSLAFNYLNSQYASVPNNTLDFSGGFSVSFYVNFGNVNNWERVVDFGNGESNNNILFGREGTTNNLWFEVHNVGTSKGVCKGTNAISNNTLDQYTFVVAVNGASCGIYKNGTYFATTVVSGSDFRPNSGINRTLNYIGRSNWSADSFFEGKIYDLAIYNRPLDGSEITQNYNSMTDVTWPTISGGNNSVNENQTAATTITADQTSFFSIFGGSDISKFSINSSTGELTFNSAPNYEAPDDSGANRIYDITVRAIDSNGNYNDYSFTVTLIDAIETTSLSVPTLSATPYKGISLTLTVTPSGDGTSIPGKVTYLIAGKRIPGCYKKTYTGSGTSTCIWEPLIQGSRDITVTFTPTNANFTVASSKKSTFIYKRTTLR